MKKIINWLPLFIMFIASATVISIYYFTNENIDRIIILQLVACAFVPAILPTLGLITKKRFPVIINFLITSHVLLANLGTALGFYKFFWWWDLFLHGYFGLLCSVIVMGFLFSWNGKHLNKIGFFIIIFTFAMAGAALWEVFEYICDNLLGNDAQGVRNYVGGEGVPSPLADTMEDIMITAVGVFVFYFAVFIDKLNGYTACKSIYNAFKTE